MQKKISLLYKVKRKLFTFLGDIKIFGLKHPMWFQINSHGYKLRGKHYYCIKKLIQPGDILIRRYSGYLSSFLLPGFWTHCGIYIGTDKKQPEQIIHAISEGVVQESLIEFMRTDYLMILRIKDENTKDRIKQAIKLAKSIVGKPYDFGFDFQNSDRFSCTELIAYCYPNLVQGKKIFGKSRIIADDFANSSNLDVTWNSIDEDCTPVIQSFFAKNKV